MFMQFSIDSTNIKKKSRSQDLSIDVCRSSLEGRSSPFSLELFWKRKLFEFSVGLRHKDVEFRGLGRDDLGVERLLVEVHLEAVRLVYRDGGHSTLNLTLDALTVDSFDGSKDRVKHHGCLLAVI